MQRLDLQFYAFFVIVLSGALLGLLFDLLRATRGYYRPNVLVGAAADLLFWGVATVAFSGALFYGNWGEIRFYVLIGLLLGIGLYYWLASPVILGVTKLLFRLLEWLTGLLYHLWLRLLWAPLLALAGLLWGALLLLWRWLSRLVGWLYGFVLGLFDWLWRPFNGPYRYMKLHYLLTKRRVKRRLRHWLLGPPRHHRR